MRRGKHPLYRRRNAAPGSVEGLPRRESCYAESTVCAEKHESAGTNGRGGYYGISGQTKDSAAVRDEDQAMAYALNCGKPVLNIAPHTLKCAC